MTHYVNENMSIGPKYDEFYSVIYLQPNRKTPADSVTDPLIAQFKDILNAKAAWAHFDYNRFTN